MARGLTVRLVNCVMLVSLVENRCRFHNIAETGVCREDDESHHRASESAVWAKTLLLSLGGGSGGVLTNVLIELVLLYRAEMFEGDLALRGPGWKYIRSGQGNEELYDLVADPRERTNRCAQQPADCDRYRARLAERVAEHRARADLLATPEPAMIDDATLQELKALGYAD